MIDLLERTCIVYEKFSKCPASCGNFKGVYYIAFDKQSGALIDSDLSDNVLVNRLHMKKGYHKFEIIREDD